MKRTVLWHDRKTSGAERCVLSASPGGFRLDGTAITIAHGIPILVTYGIRVDVNWRTRYVDIAVDGPHDRATLKLLGDSYGGWFEGGGKLDVLTGCIDVDLGLSPATLTLPLKRLVLQVGEAKEFTAALIGFPELGVIRSVQTMERLGRNRYRHRSPAFEGELLVDDDGMVVEFAGWKTMGKG